MHPIQKNFDHSLSSHSHSELVQNKYNILIQNLGGESGYYARSLNIAKLFGEPAMYFHQKALEWQQNDFLGDRHLEYIYATLLAWGMQRPGARGATMPAFNDFKDSISAVKKQLQEWKCLY